MSYLFAYLGKDLYLCSTIQLVGILKDIGSNLIIIGACIGVEVGFLDCKGITISGCNGISIPFPSSR